MQSPPLKRRDVILKFLGFDSAFALSVSVWATVSSKTSLVFLSVASSSPSGLVLLVVSVLELVVVLSVIISVIADYRFSYDRIGSWLIKLTCLDSKEYRIVIIGIEGNRGNAIFMRIMNRCVVYKVCSQHSGCNRLRMSVW